MSKLIAVFRIAQTAYFLDHASEALDPPYMPLDYNQRFTNAFTEAIFLFKAGCKIKTTVHCIGRGDSDSSVDWLHEDEDTQKDLNHEFGVGADASVYDDKLVNALLQMQEDVDSWDGVPETMLVEMYRRMI